MRTSADSGVSDIYEERWRNRFACLCEEVLWNLLTFREIELEFHEQQAHPAGTDR
ncbi:hypothetical protein GCM10023155_03470 [Bremerella cremea]